MTARLRQLGPARPYDSFALRRRSSRASRVAYVLGVVAVCVYFVISPNILALLGIDYAAPGGNLLIKLHPGTYIAALAAGVALFAEPSGAGFARLFRSGPGLAVYLLLIPICAFYSIASVGFSGAATYVESYLSAGLVAVALETATERQLRILARIILAFCLLNVAVSVAESLLQTHFIPLQIGELSTAARDAALREDSDDFRGAALYAHPLTGALVTSMAIFLLFQMRTGVIMGAVAFTILLVGLLSFGGRMALITTCSLLILMTVFGLLRGLVTRRLNLGFVGVILAGAVVLPPLLFMLNAQADIGERILSHLYYDDSMDVRSVQWQVLNLVNTRDVLFGVTPDRLMVLKYQIGLAAETTDIENFWLLMLLNLGVIGFCVLLLALGVYLAHLGRRSGSAAGWLMIVAVIVIDSSSNSLGRKTADLVFLTACMLAATGFRTVTDAAAVQREDDPPVPRPRRALQDGPVAIRGRPVLARLALRKRPSPPLAGLHT